MRLTRRKALQTGTVVAATGLAGCLGGGSGETVDSLPAPIKGSSDAPVTVQAFEDFACPHCKTFAVEVLPQIESEYIESGDVVYEHHDLPFVDEEWSWKTASAARGVQDHEGDQAFFDFAHGLYENMNNYSLDLIGTLAEDVGADPDTIETAANDLVYRPVLEADKSLGQEKGVTGTPTVFVNGEKTADFSFQTVSSAIDAQL